MKIVIFGLSISSSWGNGHATLWRGLCKGLSQLGHRVVFFERDVEWYANSRDATEFNGCDLRLYNNWDSALPLARAELTDADVGMVTSYCPDGVSACRLLFESAVPVRSFYDLDTPVTLSKLAGGGTVEYLPPEGLADFDIVLSYTGGQALRDLKDVLGARRVAPLYGSVDPDVHHPTASIEDFRGDLSYLGTYAADRQDTLERLFIEPARVRQDLRFVIGGAQYPADFPWTSNVFFVRHMPPALHSAFYCSSRLTLNVTRQAMAAMGHCPSGRIFEAASCGTPIVSDVWEGIEEFYEPSSEILLCRSTSDVLAAMSLTDLELSRIAEAARERTLSRHTALHRARELEAILESAKRKGREEELCGA